MKLDFKTMLKATLAGVLLTLGWYFCIRPLPVRVNYLREFELIAIWIILLVCWIIYLFSIFRNRNNKK